MEGDVLELRHKVAQALRAVGGVEEPRVLEAGPQHRLVAGDDGGRVDFRAVGDEHKGRKEFFPSFSFALSISFLFDGEVALVLAHHRDEDVPRKVEELWVERAQEREGGLDQPRDLFDEAVDEGGVALALVIAAAGSSFSAGQPAPSPARRGLRPAPHHLLALARGKDDPLRGHDLVIGRSVGEREPGRLDAVADPFCRSSRSRRRVRQNRPRAERLERERRGAVQRSDPPHGPRKRRPARLPPHAPPERDL